MSVLTDIAEVLEAGAKHSRRWTLNVERQQQAEVLEAMADKAREIDERNQQS